MSTGGNGQRAAARRSRAGWLPLAFGLAVIGVVVANLIWLLQVYDLQQRPAGTTLDAHETLVMMGLSALPFVATAPVIGFLIPLVLRLAPVPASRRLALMAVSALLAATPWSSWCREIHQLFDAPVRSVPETIPWLGVDGVSATVPAGMLLPIVVGALATGVLALSCVLLVRLLRMLPAA